MLQKVDYTRVQKIGNSMHVITTKGFEKWLRVDKYSPLRRTPGTLRRFTFMNIEFGYRKKQKKKKKLINNKGYYSN